VFRALIKHKRKSTDADEEQDGGRAIVVEEGLVAWIFARAKEVDFFRDQERVPLSMLKTIQSFVAGYEVEQCPLKAWERSILQGYAVFRAVRDNRGGVIKGSRLTRSISYSKLPERAR
jgi:MazG C-terminal domain